MRLLPDPRRRIPQLAAEQNTTLAALSGMLDRDASYLSRFCTHGVPARLRDEHRAALAQFFGVSEVELGGDDPRWATWRERDRRAA